MSENNSCLFDGKVYQYTPENTKKPGLVVPAGNFSKITLPSNNLPSDYTVEELQISKDNAQQQFYINQLKQADEDINGQFGAGSINKKDVNHRIESIRKELEQLKEEMKSAEISELSDEKINLSQVVDNLTGDFQEVYAKFLKTKLSTNTSTLNSLQTKISELNLTINKNENNPKQNISQYEIYLPKSQLLSSEKFVDSEKYKMMFDLSKRICRIEKSLFGKADQVSPTLLIDQIKKIKSDLSYLNNENVTIVDSQIQILINRIKQFESDPNFRNIYNNLIKLDTMYNSVQRIVTYIDIIPEIVTHLKSLNNEHLEGLNLVHSLSNIKQSQSIIQNQLNSLEVASKDILTNLKTVAEGLPQKMHSNNSK